MLTRLVSSLFKTMVCGNFCCLRQFWILKLFLSKNCRLSKFPKFPENILLFLQGAAEIWKFENISFIVGIAWDRSSLLIQFCGVSCSICGGLLKKKKRTIFAAVNTFVFSWSVTKLPTTALFCKWRAPKKGLLTETFEIQSTAWL